MKEKLLFALLMCVLIIPFSFAADISVGKIDMYFFYSNTCPHCKQAEPFIEKLELDNPELNVMRHEVSSPENQKIFHDIMVAHNTAIQGVPTFVIEDEVIVGYREGVTDKQLSDKINSCIKKCEYNETTNVVNLPLIGTINTEKMSFPIFTIIIAGLDGINPCAIWVLMFLLSLLIHAKSRKRILMIGAIFCFASGFVYFIFMAAWFNLFSLIGYKTVITIFLALLAIIIGLINIKEFFYFKQGPSLMISDKYKPKLFKKMRDIVQESNILVAVVGTFTLAFFVNLIELGCTIGLPAIFTRVLAQQNVPPIVKYSYLALYNFIYILPLLTIVAIFALTMGNRKLSENQGRILKLISGVLILGLGLIMLLKPDLLVFS
ncbi:MAG: thioredoxin domain-containing protein [archaeon]